MIVNSVLMAYVIFSFVLTGLALNNNVAMPARAIRFTSSSLFDITTTATRYVTISSIITLDSTVTVSSTLTSPSSSSSVIGLVKSSSTELSPTSAVSSSLKLSSSTSCLSTVPSFTSDVSSSSTSNSGLATLSSMVPRSSDVSFTSSGSAIGNSSIERTATSTSTIFNTRLETVVITVYAYTSSSANSQSITSVGAIGVMASSSGVIDYASNTIIPLSSTAEVPSTVTEILFSTTTVHVSRASSTLPDADSCHASSTTYITVYGTAMGTGTTSSAIVDGITASIPSIATSSSRVAYQTNNNGTIAGVSAGTSNYTSSVIPHVPLQSKGDSIEEGSWDVWLGMGLSSVVFFVKYCI